MIDYYAGWTIDQLKAELVTAQNRQARGNLIGIEASGVRTRKEFKSELEVSIIIQRIRYSLYLRTWQNIYLALSAADNTALQSAQSPAAINTILAGYPNLLQMAMTWTNPYAEKIKTTSARYALP